MNKYGGQPIAYYDLLEIDPKATPAEVRRAYLKNSRKTTRTRTPSR